ncbi:TetR/AcrR family transcriptional regulator [Yinghuangia seranimata]|uniref:TetR/AcrR family transcriptional regulator n=1 Tax=Yinghuangia seranimata TaxID=408067 RepID=UPI00248CB593|nr:TetR/AcrR family transcriptional regulator [Yinghuangia seranimata]MDI2129891.1 TetR/AcrR family transcriptional regulator [Yinghuangia seranimata]
MTSPTPARRRPGVAVLHAAACEVFAERGFHGASVRDIAQRAGVSMAALYHYYSGKQELLDAVLAEATDMYFRMCADALDAAGPDPADRLAALVDATVRYLVEFRVQSVLLLSGDHLAEAGDQERRRAVAASGTRLFADVIEDGVAQGVFRTPYPDNARRTVVAACNAIVQWYDPAGPVDPAGLVEQYVHLALTVVECVRRAGPRAGGTVPRHS